MKQKTKRERQSAVATESTRLIKEFSGTAKNQHTPTLAVERGAQGHLLIVDHDEHEVWARIEGIGPQSVAFADKVVRSFSAHDGLVLALRNALYSYRNGYSINSQEVSDAIAKAEEK